jgi:SagB-type dehydrogenase family enzyme
VIDTPPFRTGQPLAWTFHRGTSRWTYNLVEPPDGIPPQPSKEHLDVPILPLPAPLAMQMPLGEAIRGRLSCRTFLHADVRLDELATILHAAYGVIGRTELGRTEFIERPVPSGGGLYPLEVYLLVRAVDGLEPGIHHYVPLHHGVELVREGALPQRLVKYLFLGQPYAASAGAVLLISAVPMRSLWKYGDRGYRYLLLEAGHVAENVNLAAVALELGTCNLGGFFDDEVAALLRMDIEEEIVLYAVAIGRPATGDRNELRSIDDASA